MLSEIVVQVTEYFCSKCKRTCCFHGDGFGFNSAASPNPAPALACSIPLGVKPREITKRRIAPKRDEYYRLVPGETVVAMGRRSVKRTGKIIR